MDEFPSSGRFLLSCVVIMPHYDVVSEELIEKTESEIVYWVFNSKWTQ